MAAAQSAPSLAIQNAETVPPGQGSAASTGSAGTMRAAIVSLGGELFTIDLQNVREVFVVESITPVPGMPAGLVGVTNLRGSVVPLLDLRQMIGLAAENALKYAVVIKHGNWQVGVLVDTVPEIRTLSKETGCVAYWRRPSFFRISRAQAEQTIVGTGCETYGSSVARARRRRFPC